MSRSVAAKSYSSNPLPLIGVLALTILGMSGFFKGFDWIDRLPFDITLASGLVCAVAFGWVVLARSYRATHFWAVVVLWACWLPAVFLGNLTPLGDRKAILLLTVTLVCALGPRLLDARGLRILVAAHLLAGTLMMVLLRNAHQNARGVINGRLDINEVSTISSSRIIGAAVLVAILLAITNRKAFPPLLALGTVGVGIMLQVGSRGPLISLGVAILIIAMTSRVRKTRHRMAGLLAVIGLVFLFLRFIGSSRAASVQRIAGFLSGADADQGRAYLYEIAYHRMLETPQGLGWGGFARIPDVFPFSDSSGYTYPHNIFLEVGVEGGWIALLALLMFSGYCLRRLWSVSDTPMGRLLFGLAIYWLLAAQTSSDINGNRMTWVALSVGLLELSVLRRTLSGQVVDG